MIARQYLTTLRLRTFATLSIARLVITHSTYVDTLIPTLERLSKVADIRSIVPGRLSTARCSSERLDLRVTTALKNGFKLIARKGTQVQEVFIVTTLTGDALRSAIDSILPAKRLDGRRDSPE
jgi:hypothetical protein